MPVPVKGSPDYVDWVVQLAQSGIMREGIINEPRIFWDEIPQDGEPTVKFGSQGVFQNGEQFPIRLTRMIATTRFLDDQVPGVADSEINIQRIGLRMKFHDQYYMNPAFIPIPAWGNVVSATPPTFNQSTAAWDFVANGQPFVLSARDLLRVTVQFEVDPGDLTPVTVSFTGFGMLSKRPYWFSSLRQFQGVAPIDLPVNDLRNDGSEPIAITDMTVTVGPTEDVVDPQGNLRQLRINVQQVGNGTNAQWFAGPQIPVSIPNMPAPLMGVTSGRALVHQFPGDGVIWEPGEGISVETQGVLQPQAFASVLVLALSGYIMVV